MPMKAKKKGGKKASERPSLLPRSRSGPWSRRRSSRRRKAPISAASPISAANSGEAEAEDHRRQQRRFGEARRSSSCGRRCSSRVPPSARRRRRRRSRSPARGRSCRRRRPHRPPSRPRPRAGSGRGCRRRPRPRARCGRRGCGRSRGRGRSPRVIPALVAASAAPRKTLVSVLSPSARPSPIPPRKGRTTPALPTVTAIRPTARISDSLVFRPTQKSRKTTPSSEKTRSTSLTSTRPSTDGRRPGPRRGSRRRSPAGSIRLKTSSPSFGSDQDEEEVGDDRRRRVTGARLTMKALKLSPVAPAMMMFGVADQVACRQCWRLTSMMSRRSMSERRRAGR